MLSLLTSLLLLLGAQAMPNELRPRACAADNCSRAVFGTAKSTQPAQGSKDCSSFMLATVTPCAVTTTFTVTSNQGQTTTVSTTSTSTVTSTSFSTSPTVTSTVTVHSPTTVTPVTTSTLTVSSTSTATITETATVTAVMKRDAAAADIEVMDKRAATCPVTAMPSSTPTYASACTNSGTLTSRFASVCSCRGIFATTTTLATPTSTVTTTTQLASPTTVTSTVTATLTITTTVATASVLSVTSTIFDTITAPASTSTATTTATIVTTTTVTSTTTVAAPTPTLCGNAGMGWGYWYDTQPVDGWDATVHKTENPSAAGTTTQGYFLYTDGTVYGQSVATTNFEMVQRGYIYATETGPYTFEAINVDDVLDAWLGTAAYSGWNQGNVNVGYAYVGTNNGASTTTMSLTKGNYYPLRIAYHQISGYGGFNYRVTTPSGVVILGPSTSGNIGIVQYSCDGVAAPIFPPFGAET